MSIITRVDNTNITFPLIQPSINVTNRFIALLCSAQIRDLNLNTPK